jgi:hypothetical protein
VRPELIVPIVYILVSHFSSSIENKKSCVCFKEVRRVNVIEHFLACSVPDVNGNLSAVCELVDVFVDDQGVSRVRDFFTNKSGNYFLKLNLLVV